MKLRHFVLNRVMKALEENRWNRTVTAAALGISIRTVRNMVREARDEGLVPANMPAVNPKVMQGTWDEISLRILRTLEEHGGSRKKAALALGITYTSLINHVKRLKKEGHECPRRLSQRPKRKPIVTVGHYCRRCTTKIPRGHDDADFCAPCAGHIKKELAALPPIPKSPNGRVTKEEAERILSRIKIKKGLR